MMFRIEFSPLKSVGVLSTLLIFSFRVPREVADVIGPLIAVAIAGIFMDAGWGSDATQRSGLLWTDSHDCLVPLCGMVALLMVFAAFHLFLSARPSGY